MSKRLPENPNLDHLRKQARQLLNDINAGDPDACMRIDLHPRYLFKNLSTEEVQGLSLTLRDAQLLIAREYRHKTWADLVETVSNIQGLKTTPVQRVILEEKPNELKEMLSEDRSFVHQRYKWLTRWNDIQTGSLLSFAYEKGSIESMLVIVEGGADAQELQGHFFGLCENLNLDGMQRLAAIGLDPNKAFNDGWNCDVLHGCLQTYTRRSAEHLHACINVLIDAGARINDGPLWDLFRGNQDRLRQRLQDDPDLVKEKFDFDYGNHLSLRGSTLLHLAAEYNLFWAVDLLLEHGADLNARVKVGADGVGGQSPIFHIIGTNGGSCFALFEYLLGKGPDLSVRALIQEDEKRSGVITHSLRSGIVPVYDGIREVTPLGYALWYEKEPSFRNSGREVKLLRGMGAPG